MGVDRCLKIFRNVLAIMSAVLLLTGCGSSENLIDYDVLDELQTVQDDKETEEDPVEEEIISEPLVEDSGEEEIADQSGGYVQIYGRKYASVEEMFRQTDANWNTSDDYTDAIAAYAEVFNDINTGEMDFGTDELRVEAAYIDGDDIPEFLVSFGNYHICGVHVYRYDVAEGGVTHIGEFGSFGVMSYYERSSLIECYYGNMGCYTYYLSEVKGNEVKLKDSWLIDGSGIVTEEIRYYHGYFIPDMYNGSREDFENNQSSELFLNFEVDDSHQISEEEFNSELANWIGCPEELFMNVSYDEMYSIKS